ncbi:hypothetical protein QQS21_012423 [Conoideocrella luteorostrata]|uniref:Uncharacterized protein n=1 Tax=Conoideocrella luteorostrata TaxID=1105319 RepID=A0AAJ0CFQ6_9HYPO|nr:hypothetical protein QQS21_012423 [Conoideocrella luteorostrata]
MKGPNAAVLLLTCLSGKVIAAPVNQDGGVEVRHDAINIERNAPPSKFMNLETRAEASEQEIKALQTMLAGNPGLLTVLEKVPAVGTLLHSVLGGGLGKRDITANIPDSDIQALRGMVTDTPLVGDLLKGVPTVGPMLDRVLGGLLSGNAKGVSGLNVDEVLKGLGGAAGGLDVNQVLSNVGGATSGVDLSKLLGGIAKREAAADQAGSLPMPAVGALLEALLGKGAGGAGGAGGVLGPVTNAVGGLAKAHEGVVDGATGSALAPVTGTVKGVTKGLDGTLDKATDGTLAPVTGLVDNLSGAVLKREEAAEQTEGLSIPLLTGLLGPLLGGGADGAGDVLAPVTGIVGGLTGGLGGAEDGASSDALAPVAKTAGDLGGKPHRLLGGILKRAEVNVSDEEIQALKKYVQSVPLVSKLPIVSQLVKTLGI